MKHTTHELCHGYGPEELQKAKKEAKKAAKGLFYGSDVIEKINKAKSEAEVSRIMRTARKSKEF